MRKLFIIGTGRNGSKLMGKIIGTKISDKNRFGERHHGLEPLFFKNVYLGKINRNDAVKQFKQSRDKAMLNLDDFYVEKNHLVVPILDVVLEAYPDAEFLYVYRNPKDIVRSFSSRNVYTGANNVYEKGRLIPNSKDTYVDEWNNMDKFVKSCWYVYTMINMCDSFLSKIDSNAYRVIDFDKFTSDFKVLKPIFEWLGLEFNEAKVKKVLSVQIGSSARTVEELNFKVNKTKVKNTEHWENWSDEKKEAYNRFFE